MNRCPLELAPATSYYSSAASPEKGRFVHDELKIKPKERRKEDIWVPNLIQSAEQFS